MGFLGKIFGGKEKQPAPKQKRTLTAQQLKEELEKLSQDEGQELRKKSLSKFAEIKRLLGETEQDVREIKETDPYSKEGNPKLRKMAVTAKQNFLVQMRVLLEKLQPPNTEDLHEIGDYCKNSSKFIQSELLKFRKSIALTGFVMRRPVKRIGSHIKELSDVLADLSGESSSNRAFAAASLKGKLSQLPELTQRSSQTAAEIKQLLSRKEGLSAEKSKAEKKLHALRSSEESAELASIGEELSAIEKERQEISAEVLSKLSPIDKPLHRMLKLANSGNIVLSADEQAALRNYLGSPLLAIKQDPKAEVLKKLLGLLEQLIKNNTISLKDRDKERCASSISSLKEFDFFTTTFWKLNDADSRRYALEKKGAPLDITGRISEADSALEEIKRTLAGLEEEISSGREALKKTESETSKLLQAISSEATELLGAEIEIGA